MTPTPLIPRIKRDSVTAQSYFVVNQEHCFSASQARMSVHNLPKSGFRHVHPGMHPYQCHTEEDIPKHWKSSVVNYDESSYIARSKPHRRPFLKLRRSFHNLKRHISHNLLSPEKPPEEAQMPVPPKIPEPPKSAPVEPPNLSYDINSVASRASRRPLYSLQFDEKPRMQIPTSRKGGDLHIAVPLIGTKMDMGVRTSNVFAPLLTDMESRIHELENTKPNPYPASKGSIFAPQPDQGFRVLEQTGSVGLNQKSLLLRGLVSPTFIESAPELTYESTSPDPANGLPKAMDFRQSDIALRTPRVKHVNAERAVKIQHRADAARVGNRLSHHARFVQQSKAMVSLPV